MRTLISIIALIRIFIIPSYGHYIYKNQQPSSWINEKIGEYYMTGQSLGCNIKDFDNDKFIPLSLSFKNNN
jgi:hypothetical protein